MCSVWLIQMNVSALPAPSVPGPRLRNGPSDSAGLPRRGSASSSCSALLAYLIFSE